jgi:eukaryotic-like serine/threonine-protein kinase
VLDFGLAKELAPTSASSPGLKDSPTLTIRSTQAGVIMGTAAYMSPEQAAGKAVDKRTDIWSFGVLLLEMLTGRQLFAGETISHTLAHVLTAPIPLDHLPASTPPAIRALIGRCLDRTLKNRLRDIGEARVVLSNPVQAAAVETAAKPRAAAVWGWAAALGVLVLAGGAGWWRATRRRNCVRWCG